MRQAVTVMATDPAYAAMVAAAAEAMRPENLRIVVTGRMGSCHLRNTDFTFMLPERWLELQPSKDHIRRRI